MLKAILFNLDGIITNLSKFHFLAWKSIFSQHGIFFSDQEWLKLQNHSREYIIKHVLDFNNIQYDKKIIDEIDKQKNTLYQSLILNELKPENVNVNILNIISQAKAKDLKICLISHSKNANLIIERLGLSKAFDYVSIPESDREYSITSIIGSSPVTETIIKFLKESGFSGSECIGIENTREGIEEYNLYNIFSVCVNNFDPNVSKKANMSYHSIVDINLDEIIFKYYTLHTND